MQRPQLTFDLLMYKLVFTAILLGAVFYSDNSFFETEIYGKWIFLNGFAFLLMLLAPITTHLTKNSYVYRIRISINIASLIFLVKLLLEKSYDETLVVLSFVIYYFFFCLFNRDNKQDIVIISLFFIIGFTLSILAFIQYINGFILISGTYDNPAGLALTLSCITPFIILGLKKSYSKYFRIICIACIIIIGLAIYLSASRTGMIAYSFVLAYPLFKRHKIVFLVLLSIIVLLLTFCYKSQSSSGRIFIYKTTLTMIEPPSLFMGKGCGAFEKEYMQYQAKQFEGRSDNREYELLAGNTLHPLNEFLLLFVEHGALFLLIALFLTLYLFKCKWQNDASFCCLVVILIFSLFSYPFKYPITIFMLAYCLTDCKDENEIKHEVANSPFLRYMLMGISVCCICYLFTDIRHNILWKKYLTKAELGKYEEAEKGYKEIYPRMKSNFDFMYNYAATRYNAKDYMECLQLLKQATLLSNNYDTQLLTAQTYEKLQQDSLAFGYYQKAAQMCPNRFVPLYGMFKFYDSQGDTTSRNQIGVEILHKPIKIDSHTIREIQETVLGILNK